MRSQLWVSTEVPAVLRISNQSDRPCARCRRSDAAANGAQSSARIIGTTACPSAINNPSGNDATRSVAHCDKHARAYAIPFSRQPRGPERLVVE
eukprot:3477944-Pyramimonas_sp.AAC.1